MFRVRVLTMSALGNMKESVTMCETEAEADRRVAFYRSKYGAEADVFKEEFKDAPPQES